MYMIIICFKATMELCQLLILFGHHLQIHVNDMQVKAVG